METLNESTGETLFDLTCYVVATPASHSASQENDKAKTTRDTCFRSFLKPLADYDPATRSWKMFGDTYLWGESPSLETLPVSGMTVNGVLYQQPAWEPITEETESLLFPTPTAVMRPMEGNVRLFRAQVLAGHMTEQEAEQILGKSVWEAQGKLPPFPTPTASSWGNEGSRKILEKHLEQGSITADDMKAMTAGNGGRLNPAWIEWLMGFPPGWTDLEG